MTADQESKLKTSVTDVISVFLNTVGIFPTSSKRWVLLSGPEYFSLKVTLSQVTSPEVLLGSRMLRLLY